MMIKMWMWMLYSKIRIRILCGCRLMNILSLFLPSYVLRLTVFRRFDSVIDPLTEPLFASTMYRLANSNTTIKNHLIFTSLTIFAGLLTNEKFSNSIPMKYFTDLNSITFKRTLIQFHCSMVRRWQIYLWIILHIIHFSFAIEMMVVNVRYILKWSEFCYRHQYNLCGQHIIYCCDYKLCQFFHLTPCDIKKLRQSCQLYFTRAQYVYLNRGNDGWALQNVASIYT